MNKNYKEYVERHAPKSPLFRDCLRAFVCGGALCAAGEGLKNLYLYLGMSEKDSSLAVSATLVFCAVLLTGLGVFDKIASFAGAGVLLPITGFANAVAAPAIDSKTEGYVLGVGAKIFTVAGPVLLYGVTSGAIWGVIYFIIKTAFKGA